MLDDIAPALDIELEGVTDDDPTVDDETALGPSRKDTGTPKQTPKPKGSPEPEADPDAEAEDDDTDIGKLLRAAVAEDDPDATPEDKPAPKPEAKQPAPEPSLAPVVDKPGKVQFTAEQQAHIDRMFDSRFAEVQAKADAKVDAKAAELVKQYTGMTTEQLQQKQVTDRAEALQRETGLDEETALVVARQEAENQVLKSRAAEAQAAQARYERQTNYVQAKAARTADPLAKLYADDIDAFADKGAGAVDFETAYTYVLGQKVREGDLIKRLTAAIEKRVLKQVSERGRVTPEAGGGGTPTVPVANPYERKLLRAFDIDEKPFLVAKTRKKR